jgi:hypothetical protein
MAPTVAHLAALQPRLASRFCWTPQGWMEQQQQPEQLDVAERIREVVLSEAASADEGLAAYVSQVRVCGHTAAAEGLGVVSRWSQPPWEIHIANNVICFGNCVLSVLGVNECLVCAKASSASPGAAATAAAPYLHHVAPLPPPPPPTPPHPLSTS